MTVSKTTTRKMTTWEKAQQFAHGRCLGVGMWTVEEAADFGDWLTAELQKENARLREALQFIHDTLKKDEDEGYSSRDRQFAIDITKAALAGWHSQDAKPSKGGAAQKGLSKEKAK